MRQVKQIDSGRGRVRRVRGLIVLVLLLLVVAGCGVEDVDISKLRGGEVRPTLSPSYFTGRAALAYRAAREIPEVLDSLHCYCECKKNYGHKSLLTCFVDQHGLHCDVCIDEAVMAYEMHNKGKDIATIRKAVDRKFSRR